MNKQIAVPSVILFSLNNDYPGKLSAVLVSFKNCVSFPQVYTFSNYQNTSHSRLSLTEMGES